MSGAAQPSRAATRRKNRRRPDYLLIARHVTLLYLGAELLHAAFASPRLAIRSVHVAGSKRVPAARITALAAVPAGKNIFHVNLERVRERVLSEPMLRDATVTRQLPGAIVISVTERVPMLVVRGGGRAWEVDDTGVAFRERADPMDGGGLPVLDVAPADVPAVGAKLPGERFRAALQCLRLTEREALPLRKISFDERGELWLNIAVSGAEGERMLPVRLGRCEDLEAKVGQLPLVLPAATVDGEYLDLMCATRAAYRKQGTPHTAPAAVVRQASSSTGAAEGDGSAEQTSGDGAADGAGEASKDNSSRAGENRGETRSRDNPHPAAADPEKRD